MGKVDGQGTPMILYLLLGPPPLSSSFSLCHCAVPSPSFDVHTSGTKRSNGEGETQSLPPHFRRWVHLVSVWSLIFVEMLTNKWSWAKMSPRLPGHSLFPPPPPSSSSSALFVFGAICAILLLGHLASFSRKTEAEEGQSVGKSRQCKAKQAGQTLRQKRKGKKG